MKNDFINIRGILRIYFIENGKKVLFYEDENLVVYSGREAIAKLIEAVAGNTGDANKYIPVKIGVGTGDTAPSLEDYELDNEVTKIDISNTEFVSPRGIKFEATLETGNGTTFREAGLFCYTGSDYVLFARKVHNAYTKGSNDVSYSWIIEF